MRINNWTYNQVEERNRYLNRKRLLGNPLGPDTDRIRVSFSRWLRKGLKSTLSYQRTRSGEGSVNAPWSQPWMSAQGEYRERFPSGVVETEDNLGLTLQCRYSGALSCGVRWDYLNFVNYQNLENLKEDYNRISLNLSYHFQRLLH
jgi:outer membrane usher protein FimD/PapC